MISNLTDQHGRTRRNVVKAAAIAFGAFVGLLGKPRLARAPVLTGECFLRGTKIRTNSGYREVEKLAIGDLLPTTFGGVSPIQWIASHSFKKDNLKRPWPKTERPVRIMRSALDDNVPHADLYLTAAHALFIDDVLVPVGDLINGTTITLDDADELDVLEYFHIKLEGHDVIDAQGASCETLLETGAMVGNDIRTYGTSHVERIPCAPTLGFNGARSEVKSRLRSALSFRVDRRRQLDIIRDRLEERGIALCRSTALPSSLAKNGRSTVMGA